MKSWRDAILNDFIPNISKLTLVSDPDYLLTEEKLMLELHRRGFNLIEFRDPVEFRYAYESKYRIIWDRGGHTELVVALHLQNATLESLPYDLLQSGRKLSFNLGDLFPNLSYPVIEKIDRSMLDAIFDAQNRVNPERMGDNATKDFILHYVFDITAESINDEVALLRTLLRLHYSNLQIPQILTERLVQVLEGHNEFKSWPLSEIVPDGESFFAFLQKRWPIFLSSLGSVPVEKNSLIYKKRKEHDPDYLPFDHQDVKVYIDNLFLEGKLHPVKAKGIKIDTNSWVRIGIITSDTGDDELRISRLFDLVEKHLPNATSRYPDWIAFALKWAELSSLVYCGNSKEHKKHLRKIDDQINLTFTVWLMNQYASLISLPPTNPVMLHHVARSLARHLETSSNKLIALIVVDGLALDQWVTIRQDLQKTNANLVIRESAAFAWIPTLTSVSRQSIFSGKPPLYFPSSINSTNNEERLWKQFWEEQGVSQLDVSYLRGLRGGDVTTVLDSVIHPKKTRVVGLVVDMVDKIMHGMQLGTSGMHNQIKQWCRTGFLSEMVRQLLDYGYNVWLTSDHGNIQCEGKGRPSEGVIAESRGERVRIYPSPELRARVAKTFPLAHEWPPIGLPTNYFPLLADGHDAFVNQGESIVGHGGASIEEVIVPVVKFERRGQ